MKTLGWVVLRDHDDEEEGEFQLHTLKFVQNPFSYTGALYVFTGAHETAGDTVEEAIRLFTSWMEREQLKIVAKQGDVLDALDA